MKLCSNTLFHWREGLRDVFTVRKDVPLHNFLTYGDESEYILTLIFQLLRTIRDKRLEIM